MMQVSLGQRPMAIKAFQTALALGGRDPVIWGNLVSAHDAIGQHGKVDEAFRKAQLLN